MPIGAGEGRDGIYYFWPLLVKTSIACAAQISDSSALWHIHLGHPSEFVIKKFLRHSFKSNSLDDCFVYFHAKQTHNSFPISLNNYVGLFDLVHCYL